MYVAKGIYRTTEPSFTKFDALITLLSESTTPVIEVDGSLQVTLKADGYDSSTYLYSTEWDPYDALKDAVLCNYKKFNIRLFKEVQ